VKNASDALARERVARLPVHKPEHPPPLAEHHHFAPFDQDELSDQRAAPGVAGSWSVESVGRLELGLQVDVFFHTARERNSIELRH
jgi:hypothetical protein